MAIDDHIPGDCYRVVRTFGGESYERRRFEKSSRINQQQNLEMVVTKAASTEIIRVVVAGVLAVLRLRTKVAALTHCTSPTWLWNPAVGSLLLVVQALASRHWFA
jgi:hypothetical protein